MGDIYDAADGAAFELQVTNCPSQVTLAKCCYCNSFPYEVIVFPQKFPSLTF
jgi:hypothetical protein